jgi:hypothetical protein
MGRSVDALARGDRERYLDLAVFPEDDAVPMTVVAKLWRAAWRAVDGAGRALLVRLDCKALLTLAGKVPGGPWRCTTCSWTSCVGGSRIQPRCIGRCSTPTGRPPTAPRQTQLLVMLLPDTPTSGRG